MKKRMKLIPFLSQSKSLCPFPSYCANINTLSFRATNTNTNTNTNTTSYTFTTFNSTYLNSTSLDDSFSTILMSDDSHDNNNNNNTLDDPIESIIRGLRSERLFFEPEKSCSLVIQPDPDDESSGSVVYKESEALCMDSNNPCEDFRRSMEEMVEAHGLKNDWQGLEELLGCYLKINDIINHGYIMGAFIDLLLNISFNNNNNNNSTTTTTSSLLSTNLNGSSPSSPLSLPSSNLTTPCLSSLLDHHDDDDEDNVSDDHDKSTLTI